MRALIGEISSCKEAVPIVVFILGGSIKMCEDAWPTLTVLYEAVMT